MVLHSYISISILTDQSEQLHSYQSGQCFLEWTARIWSSFFFIYCYSITVVCIFSPSLHPTPAKHTSLPHLHPPLWFCPCVLYSSSCNPLSPLSPLHSPLEFGVLICMRTNQSRPRVGTSVYISHLPSDLDFHQTEDCISSEDGSVNEYGADQRKTEQSRAV